MVGAALRGCSVRALAFEHLRPNPIGVYGDVLDGRGIGVDRVMLDQGEAIPDWRAYDFLVVMGAAADVWDHDRHPWIAAEKETVREAVLAGVPYFGVCFGAQLLAGRPHPTERACDRSTA
jgi:GMP synthase (glutamine-hydrolysing)